MLNCLSGTPSLGKLGHQSHLLNHLGSKISSPEAILQMGYKRVPKLVYFDSLFFVMGYVFQSGEIAPQNVLLLYHHINGSFAKDYPHYF